MRKPWTTAALMALASISAAAPAGSDAGKPVALAADDPSLEWGACPPIFSGDCRIAVLNGDPSAPNADILLRVGPGYELPRHRHSSAERMVLLEGDLWVDYDGAEPVTLTPGTYAYGPAGLPHVARCVSDTRCVLFIAFEEPVDVEPVAAPAR